MELREALTNAMNGVGANSPPPDTTITEPADEYRDEYSADLDKPSESNYSETIGRDSKGRFLPKGAEQGSDTATLTEELNQGSPERHVANQNVEEQPVRGAQSQDGGQPAPEAPPMPSYFGKHRELWQKLHDPNSSLDRNEILQFSKEREVDFHKGLAQYKDQAEKSHYLARAMEPFIPDLLSEGIDPATHVRNLSQAHFILSKGTPEDKVKTFQYLANAYGIAFNPDGQSIAPMDSAAIAMQQQLRGIQNQVEFMQNERLQKQSHEIQLEIERLEADKTNFPLFSIAREAMASLLENGHAKTFQEAYTKAIRLDDSLWEEHLKRQSPSTPKPNTQSHVAKAKQAAVSVKTTAPTGGTSRSPKASPATNQRNSIKEALTRAFNQSR